MQPNLAMPELDEPPYLAKLNPEQKRAVENTEGPLLVLAGAGTGKTRVLTTRMAHIIFGRRAFPNQILAVTFTNKAAREMRERVATALGQDVGNMWIGTFHSICAKILRRHAKVLDFGSNFSILDDDDQIRLIKKVMAELNIDSKKWSPRVILGLIQSFKDKGLLPPKVDKYVAGHFADGKITDIYALYQRRLRELNAMDFGDLLLHALTLFKEHKDILEDYHRYFRYVLVDEYQDTNVAQYEWMKLLSAGSGNICCVGDDDQSIYSWRGAEVGNILRFEKDFPNAKVIKLERNYRSTGHILAAASGVIANNSERLGKTLWTEDVHGERIKIKHLWDDNEEAKFVAGEVEALSSSLTREKHAYNQFAVLVRAGYQTRAFEERFLTLNIPYRVVGGLRFYERQEIRDAIAYMRVMNDGSNDLAFERIINLPKRGIGKQTLDGLYRKSRSNGISLFTATQAAVRDKEVPTKAARELEVLIEGFERWRELLKTGESHADVVATMLDESGYINMWKEEAKKERSPEAEGRLENLEELIRALGEFENLDTFLEHISLVMDNDNNASDDMVNVMTYHAAKGLEFDTVFLPGWEEGVFPSQKSVDEKGTAGLEEERRLAYVGITRARKNLYICHAANRRVYNQWQVSLPSRFLKELPEGNVDMLPNNLNFYNPQPWNLMKGQSSFDAIAKHQEKQALEKIVQARAEESGMAAGQRVFHVKFGYGKIVKANGDNLEINFDHTGVKTLKSNFVEKA